MRRFWLIGIGLVLLAAAGGSYIAFRVRTPRTLSAWLASVSKPEFKLKYSGESPDYYLAVFEAGPDELVVSRKRLGNSSMENGGAPRVESTQLLDENRQSLMDGSRKIQSLLERRRYLFVSEVEEVGTVFPIRRGYKGKIRVVWKQSPYSLTSDPPPESGSETTIVDIEISH